MPNLSKILEKADKFVLPLPILRFKPVAGKGSIFDSKLGGIPYFPKSMEYPKGKKGDYKDKPLRLLAQLNFNDLPHIEEFPTQGILQIFIACEDDFMYGFGFDESDSKNQNGYRIIYHKDIITDTSKLLSDDDIPYDSFCNDEDAFPLKKEYILKPEMPDKDTATPDDFRFEKALVNSYNETENEKISYCYEINDEDLDKIYNRSPEKTAFIGGYPIFTQSDPRESDASLQNFDRVLFELKSLENEEINKYGYHDYDIIWGDVGTGTFLISSENLKSCDFSSVIYNYDCG